jgi:nicotinate dehydrogenase subunit B
LGAGAGLLRRNDAGDAGIDAALLSKAAGQPVRVQGMRYEGHGWDPKGPASIHRARAALDEDGAVIGYVFESRGLSRIDTDANEERPRLQRRRPADGPTTQVAARLWRARRILWLCQQAAGLGDDRPVARPRLAIAHRASPRPGRPTDPVRQRIVVDEITAAIGADPVAFRLRYLKESRDIAVVKAAAERAGCQPRPLATPRPHRRHVGGARNRLRPTLGRRGGDRRRGRDRPPHRLNLGKKFTVAHDCGLIINPDGLRRCIEGNVVQGTSRALSEEVAFDRAKVTSTDWPSYPILDITEAPETIAIVLINRPDLPPAGARESSIRPVAAAIANAVFDATDVRLRRAPLTPSGSSRRWLNWSARSRLKLSRPR